MNHRRAGWIAAFVGITTLCCPALAGESSASVAYRLGSVESTSSAFVRVPFDVTAKLDVSVLTWSVEFDPSALAFESVELSDQLRERLSNPESEDGSLHEDSELEVFVDSVEGWVQISLVSDYRSRGRFAIPPGLLRSGIHLVFRVADNAAEGTYPLRFSRVGEAEYAGNFLLDGSEPVYNRTRAFALDEEFSPESKLDGSTEAELADGEIVVAHIIGDVGVFLRGDANIDGFVDVSDPIRVLGFLFVSAEQFVCPRTADVNSDRALDISDPIAILTQLFVVDTFAPEWIPVGYTGAHCAIDTILDEPSDPAD